MASPSAADAVLPAGDGWRVFRLGALRHAQIPGAPEAWKDGEPAHPEWRTLAAPPGPFRPVQAVPAQRGYFHLVDAASGRLCLYDTAAGLISTFPLPEEFTPFPAGRTAVFRGADGAFTFLDYASGEARQFADRQTGGAGAVQWIARGKVKMPAGLRSCMQPPGAADLFCVGAGGSPLRFDGALNRIPVRGAAGSGEPGSRAIPAWDAEAGEWAVEGRTEDGAALFRFLPAQRRWKSVSSSSLSPLRPPSPPAP